MFHQLRRKYLPVVLVAAVAVLSGASQSAQQKPEETLQVMSEKNLPWAKTEPDNFAGEVAVQYLLRQSSANVRVSRVRFQPGAHTNWHVHLQGQILYIESGRGRVQKWGGEIKEVGPGDVIYTAPGEKHWHGAATNAAMTHIATTVGTTEWKEKVVVPNNAPKK